MHLRVKFTATFSLTEQTAAWWPRAGQKTWKFSPDQVPDCVCFPQRQRKRPKNDARECLRPQNCFRAAGKMDTCNSISSASFCFHRSLLKSGLAWKQFGKK